jgi:hypothetical protein
LTGCAIVGTILVAVLLDTTLLMLLSGIFLFIWLSHISGTLFKVLTIRTINNSLGIIELFTWGSLQKVGLFTVSLRVGVHRIDDDILGNGMATSPRVDSSSFL